MRLFKNLLCAAAMIPLGQCLVTGPVGTAQAQEVPAATGQDDADPALWVVKDADTTIYLFGTVHILKPGLSWFDEAVKDAFDKSDTLRIEMIAPEDPNEIAARAIPIALDQSGTPLSSLLNESERSAYEALANKFGLPLPQFDALEPWFVGLTLGQVVLMAEGYKADAGVEKILTGAAKGANKPIEAFETLEEQLGFLDKLPRPAQLQFLNDTVAQAPTAATEFTEVLFAWARGKPEELGELINRSMSGNEPVAEALLFQRNARWAEWIKGRLDKPGSVFVAVGAGHLAGPKSVQDYLTAHGIKAERIAY